MKVLFFLLFLFLFSCKDSEQEQIEEPVSNNGQDIDLSQFSSVRYGFSFSYPQDYDVFKGQLPGEVPVVNVFRPDSVATPPFAIHEEAHLSYLAFLPEGYGVDGPAGDRTSFDEYKGELSLGFEVDALESTVYLLESGEAWAYYIRPQTLPENWGEHGGIFVHFPVRDLETRCWRKKDQEFVRAQQCDPLMGDKLQLFGEVSSKERERLISILETVKIKKKFAEPVSKDIIIKMPQKSSRITSPLVISGKARGYWFFEGVAPFKLVTEKGQVLSQGTIEAKENWMTEAFVPFETRASFNKPLKEKRGYLVISRANASGIPEREQSVRVPVIFKD